MTTYRIATAVLLFALAGVACADDLQSLRTSDIVAGQAQVRAQIESGSGSYAGLDSPAKAALLQKQARLLELLEGTQGPAELAAEQQVEVRAALAALAAPVASPATSAAEEKMVCRREKTIGSNRVSRVCKPASQIEQEREQARQSLDHRVLETK